MELTNAPTKELTNDDINELNTWLYIKDKFNLSNEAWNELAQKSKDIPCQYRMVKRMQALNSKWEVKPTPGDAEGIQIEFGRANKEVAEERRALGK